MGLVFCLFVYLCVNCLIFYRLFIYLIIYLLMFAIYLFGSCVYFLLSFRWFPFLFVFAANDNRCYLIFIFYSPCKMGGEKKQTNWATGFLNGVSNGQVHLGFGCGQQVISHHIGGKKLF